MDNYNNERRTESDWKEIANLSDKVIQIVAFPITHNTIDVLTASLVKILHGCEDQERINLIIEKMILNLKIGIRTAHIIRGVIPLTDCTEEEIKELNFRGKNYMKDL